MQSRTSTWVLFFTLATIWLFSATGFAATKTAPLPADQAFMLSVNIANPKLAMIEWRIAPGYYLYSKRIHISLLPAQAADIRIPQGDLKYDTNQGRLEVFSGSLTVPVQLKAIEQKIELNVDYQGCSEGGFCYPPIHKSVLLNFVDNSVIEKTIGTPPHANSSFTSLLTDQQGIRALLGAQHFAVMLLIFAGIGLLLTFTPCVLPMIPIVMGIIVGQKKSMNTKKGLFLSSIYVLGSSVTYALAGILAAVMGSSLQVWLQQPWVIGAASGIFILLSLSLFGLYELQLPSRLQNKLMNLSNKQQGGNYAGVFLMGILSALIVSPCVTAPLVGVLMYISQTGDVVLGGSALFAMGLGMGIPLILIGASAGKWLPRSGPWMEVVKKIFGLLMLGMAIWLLSRITSSMVTMTLLGLLLVGIAVFLAVYLPRFMGRLRQITRGLGLAVGLSGMLLMFDANIPTKISALVGAKQTTRAAASFTIIRDIESLNKQLLIAQAAHKPVVLDFYADWCESCVVMDSKVFGAPTVQQVLNNYVLLRADLTANSKDDQALMKQFDVIAPPTVLFFNAEGREMNADRVIGEVNAKEFLARMDNLWNRSELKK